MYFPPPPPVPITDEEIPVPSGGTPVSGFRFMAYASDGTLELADNRNRAHMNRLAGISLTDAAEGEVVKIRRSGSVSDQTLSYDVTKPLFVGQNGVIVQVSPTNNNCFVCNIGMCIAPTEIIIDIQQATWRT